MPQVFACGVLLLFFFEMLAAILQRKEGANACDEQGEENGEPAVAFGIGASEDELAQIAENDAGDESEDHGFAPESECKGADAQGAEEQRGFEGADGPVGKHGCGEGTFDEMGVLADDDQETATGAKAKHQRQKDGEGDEAEFRQKDFLACDRIGEEHKNGTALVFVQDIDHDKHSIENDIVEVKNNADHLKSGVIGVFRHVVKTDVAKEHGKSPAQQRDDEVKSEAGFSQLQAHKMAQCHWALPPFCSVRWKK